MAQTKRKRRTKHRGNAAGMIEARGRTGRKPTEQESRKSTRETARERRMNRPPTWNGALMKAGLMAGLLFVFTRIGLLGAESTVAQSLTISLIALLAYTPLAYYMDRWVYLRNQRRKAQGGG